MRIRSKFTQEMHAGSEDGAIRKEINRKGHIGVAGVMQNEDSFGFVDFLLPCMIDEVVIETSM